MNQNKKALFGYRLAPLNKIGFEIENQNKYWGYKGIYRNYFIRIFYEVFIGEGRVNQIYFVLYYKAPPDKTTRQVRRHLVHKYDIGRELKTMFWNDYKIAATDIDITRYEDLRFINSFKQIQRRIDFLVDLAEKEGLFPLSETEIPAVINNNLEIGLTGPIKNNSQTDGRL